MRRKELTEEQWRKKIAPLLPPQKPRRGRPAQGTTASSSTPSFGYCAPGRLGGTYQNATGLGRRSPAASTAGETRACGSASWRSCRGRRTARGSSTGRCISSTAQCWCTRPPTRCGRKRGRRGQAIGRTYSRGGLSTKVHDVKAEGGGRQLAFVVAEGQRHDSPVFEELMEKGKVKRNGAGRSRLRPGRLTADRSYRATAASAAGSRQQEGPGAHPAGAPREANRRFDGELYKERNRVERLVARLKQFRRVVTRYEKTAESYLAMLTLAALLLWL